MIESLLLAQASGGVRAQAEVFNEIFQVFLGLGTLVGVVVVSYTLYNAYKYRDRGEVGEKEDVPVLGELPTGQGGPKAKKLFLSFGLSAIIVISLVVYAYGLLLYVEEGPSEQNVESDMQVDVVGYQFGWEFQYPNGATAQNKLRVPQDAVIRLDVTSRDVWHNFGAPELRIKSDAIPGQTSETWFSTQEANLSRNETVTYKVKCYELCGSGHSYMTGQIIVMNETDFNKWYKSQAPKTQNSSSTGNSSDDGSSSSSDGGH